MNTEEEIELLFFDHTCCSRARDTVLCAHKTEIDCMTEQILAEWWADR